MSRYFFNVGDDLNHKDVVGTEFPTLLEAQRHAARFAGELLQSNSEEFWTTGEWRMEVTDASGLILFYLLFVGIDAPALGTQ